MKYMAEEIEYSKLYDSFLADKEDAHACEVEFSTYIVNEEELQIVKKIFDIIFTNLIDDTAIFRCLASSQMQIASIEFPSELVSFIKGIKSIKDKNRYLDQFRLNALLHIFDEENGQNGLRDFFRNDNDVLKLKDFFSKNKAKIMDFLRVKNIHLIIGLIENNGNDFVIYDVDDFIENIASSVGMTRHAEINTFVEYKYSNSDREFVENLLNQHFTRLKDGVIEGKQSELIRFIEDATGKSIPKNSLEFLRVYSMNEDDFEQYMSDRQIGDLDYFLEIEKNALYKNISTYDMNPLFRMHGNMNDNFGFKIPIEYVEISNYVSKHRWDKPFSCQKNINTLIKEWSDKNSHDKGNAYEELVAHRMVENHGYTLIARVGASNDGGADIIMIDNNNKRVVIQCKYISKGSVRSAEIAQVLKGMKLREAEIGILCSNRPFSSQCQEEAYQLDIELKIVR